MDRRMYAKKILDTIICPQHQPTQAPTSPPPSQPRYSTGQITNSATSQEDCRFSPQARQRSTTVWEFMAC